MTEPERDDREIVREAAATAARAAGFDGIVTRAVIVIERVDGDTTNLSTMSSTDLPWETAGLLDYAKHQVLRIDDQDADQ